MTLYTSVQALVKFLRDPKGASQQTVNDAIDAAAYLLKKGYEAILAGVVDRVIGDEPIDPLAELTQLEAYLVVGSTMEVVNARVNWLRLLKIVVTVLSLIAGKKD